MKSMTCARVYGAAARLLAGPGIAVLLAIGGCAAEPARPAEAPRGNPQAEASAKGPEVNTWGPQSPQSTWWEPAEAACPEGAKLVGAPPPKGNTVQCVLPDGKPHGRSSVWFENGHEGTLTEHKNGVRYGKWMYWLHNHTMAEGQFEDGRRHGTWKFWFDQGSGFDMRARYEPDAYNGKNYVIEQYNKGLLLGTKRYRDGKPVPDDQREPVQAVSVLPGDATP
jgi:hypothetical protein